MKIQVYMLDGSTNIVNLGDISPEIDINGLDFFEFMLDTCLEQGVNIYQIAMIKTISSTPMIN